MSHSLNIRTVILLTLRNHDYHPERKPVIIVVIQLFNFQCPKIAATRYLSTCLLSREKKDGH